MPLFSKYSFENTLGKRETHCSTPEMNCTRDQIKSWLALTLVRRRRGDGDRLRSLDRGQINYRLVQNRQAGEEAPQRGEQQMDLYFQRRQTTTPGSPKKMFSLGIILAVWRREGTHEHTVHACFSFVCTHT